MKNTKQLNVTKTPIDIKRRLDLASRNLLEAVRLLSSLDQTSFPPGYLHEAASLSDLALAAVLQLDTVRPRKKTERPAPATEAPITGDTPDLAGPTEGFDTSFDFGANVVEADAAVEAAPEPAPSVEELRRMRKRERDRESAARRRAARAS